DKSRQVYRASYIDPVSGRRRTVSAKTKGAAAEKRDARLDELAETVPGGRLGDAPTVADVAAWWIDNVAAVTVRPATLHTYSKDAARVVDYAGGAPVTGLDTEMVRG